MIRDLKPYPAYRDSGVEWLGEVPEHWEVARLKTHLVRNDPGAWGTDFADDGTIVLRSTEQTIEGGWRVKNPARRQLSQAEKKATLLHAGDLVVTKSSGSPAHIGKTSLVTAQIEGMECGFSNFMQRLRPDSNTAPRFMWAFLNNRAGRDQLVCYSTTTTGLGNLNGAILGSLWMAFPPPPEQSAVVRFLGHVNRRIRRCIRSKQKLIALLHEQRQAIIHRAVTRGLDPDVPLKPSGVEWLGDVPENWQVVPLRKRWTVTDCKHLTVSFVEEGIPLASVREVQSFDLDLAKAKRTTTNWYEVLAQGDRVPRRGDLIYCRNVSVGAAAFVDTDEQFAMGQDVCMIRSQGENQRYLNYFLHGPAMGCQLASLMVGSTFDRINVSEVKGLIIAVPPRAEQDAISGYLDESLGGIRMTIEGCLRGISLLREYRTRLIADVVTGKLDVREAATHLPEETGEPEPLDETDTLAEDITEETEAPDPDALEEAEA